jgi:tetratricopeptide (TPR) repeat protein
MNKTAISNIGEPGNALVEIRRAGSRDPEWTLPRALEGEFLMHGGQYDQSLAQLNGVIQSNRSFWLAYLFRAFVLVEKRQYREAIADCDAVDAVRQAKGPVPPYSMGLALKGYALAKLGQTAEATAVLHELETQAKSSYVPPSQLALLLRALGRHDEAMAQLEKAVKEKDVIVTFFGVAPLWDEWRELPEFKKALEAANLLKVSETVRSARGR